MTITTAKELKEDYTNIVQRQFEIFLNEINENNDINGFDKVSYNNLTEKEYNTNLANNKDLKEFLNSISIRYDSNFSCSGYAVLKQKEIVINSRNIIKINALIIHEFSHLAIWHFSGQKIAGHTLEFAIFNYCLDNRFNLNSDNIFLEDEQKSLHNSNRCFFRSYDIHEDPLANLLMINPIAFDTMIKNISFSTLQDLYNKSVKLASKIRKKTFAL